MYIGDSDGMFYCLDARSGKKKWKFQTDAEINSSANFYKNCVLFGSQDAKLYCLKADSGEVVWKYESHDQIRCFPTVVGDRAFVAGCDGNLHVVDLEKGTSAGQIAIESPTGCTPAVLGRQPVRRHRGQHVLGHRSAAEARSSGGMRTASGRCPTARRRPSRPRR